MIKNQDLVILYESGLTIKEISKQVNFSYETIRKILKSCNVKWRRNYVSDFTNEQISSIINKFDAGEAIEKIAKWYEISPPAISRLLRANDRIAIPARKKYEILRQHPINTIQKQLIVGSLLGDGCLYKDSKNSNFKLSLSQCKAQEQYFHHKVALMDPFINGFRENVDKRGNSIMLAATTICHQDFNMFGNMFYDKNRKKFVPDNLDIYLTPLALAIWVQDDGSLNAGVNMRIASMGFDKKDNEKLQRYLKTCFDLNAKVMEYRYKNKLYYQLTFNKVETQKLSDIIRPHVVPKMLYKIMPESSTTTRQTSF